MGQLYIILFMNSFLNLKQSFLYERRKKHYIKIMMHGNKRSRVFLVVNKNLDFLFFAHLPSSIFLPSS
ncbi:hypothetical protein BDC45DRAFT_324116 [Circinella umbellata]|nr:hypothetical protein BDC45DRAFT_324116 [Circinella umbellata]